MADSRDQFTSGLTDRYSVERELGRGGMATVYLARDLRHRRPVALKVLHPELAYAVGADRFLREIEMAANLTHPHILSVHDSGDAAGQLWFTMPFIEGESLRDRLLREKQLPIEDAVRIAREAAEALDYAHRHGVIHRDIKPENILLSEGHALVADFGVARPLGASGDQLTQTGMSVGTPAYMSPEQASGTRDLDARTDVYSLATVLYEMLAGEPPFTGPTPQAAVARRFIEAPRPLRLLRETVPEAVEQAVLKGLAKAPADRFSSAAEFARALIIPAVGTPIGTPAGAPITAAPAPASAPPRPAARRPVPAAAVTLGLGILIGLGVLFGWLRSHGGEGAGEAKVLAVLPFENQGAAQDEYFADGVTDAVRGKLAALPAVQVIARGSSAPYKKTSKAPEQIARELGARYLLTGTVRWEKRAGGQSRVLVSPELVEVPAGGGPKTRWQQPFDASLTDVFQVQADIAGRVAEALGVALGSRQQEALRGRPTASLEAYDALLRGDEISRGLGTLAPGPLLQARPYYERAVAIDSGFALAWTRLARLQALLYNPNFFLPADSAAAARASSRALAQAPSLPDTRLALGEYYWRVELNNERALEQFELGRRLAPSDARFLGPISLVDHSLGRWEEAVAHAHEGFRLDPRSSRQARLLSRALVFMRRYDEALAAADQAVALEPTSPDNAWARALVHVSRGDLAAARTVYREASPPIPRPTLVAFMSQFWEMAWTLDSTDIDLLVSLSPEEFGGDRAEWGLCLAQGWALKGDSARARIYADSGRIAYEEQLRANPRNDQAWGLLGLTLAYLGRYNDAIAAANKSVALRGPERDKSSGVYNGLQLARVYAMAGRLDQAATEVERLLRIASYLSPAWFKIDPTFAPLRGNPRFDRLVNGS